MIRSIYIKNILNYFFVIIVSLILSFNITFFLFQKQVTQLRETEVIAQGKSMIILFQRLGEKEFNELLKNPISLSYDFYIYQQSRLVATSPDAHQNRMFSQKNIEYVLNGGVYRKMIGTHRMAIGLPFESKNQRYAFFIIPSLEEQFSQMRSIIFTALFFVLFLGIALILITTRFLVKPVGKITKATREIAKGNLKIRLNVKSKDEIGQLAESFNSMAAELEKQEQMRKDFVANVSHELQSPLTAVRGMAIALKDDAVDPEEKRNYFEQIEQESERLSRLIKQLLNLSSLEADKSPFHPKPYRLDRQMRNQLVAMQSFWMDKQLEIDFDIPSLEVFADEGLLNQVWTNLYSNAIKYNWPKGVITIRGYDREDHIEVVISNTGDGIPKEDLPHIFERFYRVEKAHSRAAESYGLGLAVVKRIIDLHNGEISVSSVVGNETTFRVRLKKIYYEKS